MNEIHLFNDINPYDYQITSFFPWLYDVSSTQISIIYTQDYFAQYNPFTPWLTLCQNNHDIIRLNQCIRFEFTYDGKQVQTYGWTYKLSHLVKNFAILIVKTDPQFFGSAIYLAVPIQWFKLSFTSKLKYYFTYRHLSKPTFTHLLNPEHPIYSSFRQNSTVARICC